VFVGFGSMNNIDSERLTDIVLRAARAQGPERDTGHRLGRDRDTDLPKTVVRVEDVPHEWLFERVRAAVTTAALAPRRSVLVRRRSHRRGALLRRSALLGKEDS